MSTECTERRAGTLVGMPGQPLLDSFGRRAKDLRLSITDRCNFRCTYCMPAEGLAWLPRDEVVPTPAPTPAPGSVRPRRRARRHDDDILPTKLGRFGR